MSREDIQVYVQTAFLGDLILSVPTLVHMKQLWPNEKLYLVARRGVGSFLLNLNIIDGLIEIEKGQSQSYKNAIESLKSFEIKRIVSPHESLRTTLFVHRLKSPLKISYKNFWSRFFYDQIITKKNNLPEVIRQMDLLSSFDIELKKKIENADPKEMIQKSNQGLLPAPPAWSFVSLRNQVLSNEKAGMWFASAKSKGLKENSFYVFFPGSTWETKRWTEEGFVQLGQKLAQQGVQIVFMGSPNERALCERIKEKIPQALNGAGETSLLETLYVLAQSQMVVGNDSASAHMASLVEAPTVTFFGPTVLSQGFRPWGLKSYIVENESLPCRPCGKHGHRRCPLGTHECMKSLDKVTVPFSLRTAK